MAAPISAEEVAHRAASDAELIAWVDEQDRPLGSLPRAELRERGLIGRGTFILLFNSAGELCVQRRTLSKAVYPGYWDLAAGGMVQAGEPYADSAARELEEELGIRDAVLREHGRFFLTNRATGSGARCFPPSPMRPCACRRRKSPRPASSVPNWRWRRLAACRTAPIPCRRCACTWTPEPRMSPFHRSMAHFRS